MKLRSHRSARLPGALVLAVPAFAALVGLPSPVSGQGYTVEDWLTVSTVGEYVWAPDGSAIYFTSNAAPTGTAAVFRVDPDGGAPVLLSRTPYDTLGQEVPRAFTAADYAVVQQNTRGRFASEGTDEVFDDDGWREEGLALSEDIARERLETVVRCARRSKSEREPKR